jgi:four helix bundle protein
MEASKSFRDLIVWNKAHQLVLDVYRSTRQFPREELYGLTSQFRRSTVSIAANIAEGFAKKTMPEKLRFLNIAQGSLEETRYYLILAHDLEYGDFKNMELLAAEVSRLLNAYINSIRRNLS